MAFNPQIPGGEVPSGLSYSRGAGAGDRSAAYKGQAAGTMLSGIGGAVSTALAGADEVIKQKIYNEIDTGTDSVQSLFGVDDATAQEGGSINPVELGKAKSNLARLQNAYINGDIKPSHYFAKLNVMTKSLKARYPGYEREIDQTVASITGSNPANSLMSSLEQEANQAAAQRDAAASKWFTYETQNQEFIERAYPGYFTMPEDKRPSQAEVMSGVASLQAEDSRLRSITLSLEADIKKGQLSEKNLVTGAKDVAGSMVSQTLAGGFASLGNNYTEIRKTLDQFQNNPEAVTPEALQELQMGTANLLMTVQSNLQAQLSTGPYAQLDNATRKSIIEGAIAPLQTMVDAINNEDYGLVGVQAAFIKATEDKNVAQMLKTGQISGDNVIQRLQAVKSALGPDAFAVWLAIPENTDAVRTALEITAMGNAALGTGDTLADDLKKAADTSPSSAKSVLSSVLDSISSVIASPNLAPNVVGYVYTNSQDTIDQFKASQRADVYSTMYSPKYVQDLIKLKETDPTVWEAVKKSAMDSFTETSRPIIAEINELPEAYSSLIDVAFNRETGQLEVRPNGAFLQQTSPISGMAGPDPLATDVAIQEMIRNYQQLNKMLYSMRAVVEADDGNFVQSVDLLLQSMGVRYSNPLSPDERDEKPDLSQQEIPQGDSGAYEFLAFVQSLEAPAGYNQIYNDKKGVLEAPLDEMTIDEVLASQKDRINAGTASSATGGMQIMYDTLKDVKKAMGLTGQEYFDQETQLAIGLYLLERRGLSKYRSGEWTTEQFADSLAQEWAAFPLANGKSYYSKVGKNRALTDRETFLSMVPLLAQAGPTIPYEEGLSFFSKGRPEAPKPDVYANIPDIDGTGTAGQKEKFRRWNPDPVGLHEERLSSVRPELQGVVRRAQEISGVKFVVASGLRTDEEQKLAQEFGWSKTDESNHETADAVDIWVLDENGQVTFDPALYEEVNRAMATAAAEQGAKVDWGGDWKNKDIPHFEYKGEAEVASNE